MIEKNHFSHFFKAKNVSYVRENYIFWGFCAADDTKYDIWRHRHERYVIIAGIFTILWHFRDIIDDESDG